MALAMALSACAGFPENPSDAKVKPASNYQADQSFTAPDRAWPRDEWWRAYGDPQLDQLIAEGLNGAPDLKSAAARLVKAQAAAETAGASLLPTVNGTAQITADKQSYNQGIPSAFVPKGYHDNALARLDFTYEFDFFGKNRAALDAALGDARASEADLAAARLTLSTNIAAAYADFANQIADREVAARSVGVRQATLDLVKSRVSKGLDTNATLKQAEAEAESARSDLAADDEDIARTRNRIAALLGAGPDRGLSLTPPAAPALKPFGLPEHLAADLIGRRPDVVAARWRVEANTNRIVNAKAQFYPNIDLVASIGLQSLGAYKLFRPGSDIGSVGPAVTLPIFEAGRLEANLKGAGADYEVAVAQYDAALTQALHDVADAAASQRALNLRLDTARRALAASEDAYRLARLRYEGQLADYQTVLTAETTLLGNRRRVSDLEARGLILDVTMVRALGGGYSNPA